MTSKAKPRPTDQEALFLITMRRERSKDILNEILNGFSTRNLAMPTPVQILDYLTNTILYIEMSLKLLSGDWRTHNVGEMYKTATGRPHSNQALMQSLKDATMSQKYLLSPSEGLIDHIPELESLGDQLKHIVASKYESFSIYIDQEAPETFTQFLLTNAHRLYKQKPESIPPGSSIDKIHDQLLAARAAQIAGIIHNLQNFLSKGNKLLICQGRASTLRF